LWILAASVFFSLLPSYLIVISLSRSAKLRCGGSNPPGASTCFHCEFNGLRFGLFCLTDCHFFIGHSFGPGSIALCSNGAEACSTTVFKWAGLKWVTDT
jgi:hypothetical protein